MAESDTRKKNLRFQARLYAKGQSIQSPEPELALFVDCKNWGTLPQKGGIYDQNPEIIESFRVIQTEINKVEREEAKKQEMKSKRK